MKRVIKRTVVKKASDRPIFVCKKCKGRVRTAVNGLCRKCLQARK